ncbi:hypothetical protein BDB00DRAFT_879364 [Zychaea mexicana]|uniref:uncharacterized protein n=1 Tax=Zychaea mexicana TaxID=64656 RepID=UPI0022FE1423|nr:uncharacterized protein BDB00DRAFT_879364 [Zychaea mexicana]KAI9479507.1 hypothetical protein BDB00DRAFT_879364 [Zychaea mexicana]
MSTTEVDMNGSPTDRSKRPRLEDGDWDSDYERDGQDDRHPKRQAVPDPETKAPHFAGATEPDSDTTGRHESNGAAASSAASASATGAAGASNNNNNATQSAGANNGSGTGRSRRKKWEEGGSQDSDDNEDDEVQILLDSNGESKGANGPDGAAAANNTGAQVAAAASTSASAVHYDAAGSDAQSLASFPPGVPSVSIRSLVSTKDAGVIIGRGGKNVSEIREMSAARVTISDIIPMAYERILTVTGPVNAVAKAYALVAQKILLEMPNPDEGQDQSLTIRLLVADQRMGTLIGRGGSVIRSIQEHSHARVNASEEPLPLSTERTVTIVGTTDAVQSAIQQISEILAEHPERVNASSTVQYRPQPQGTNMSTRSYHGGMGGSTRSSSAGVSGGANAVAAAASSMNPYGAAMMGHMGGMPMSGANPQFYYQAAAAAAAAGAYGGMPSSSSRQGDYGMAGMVASSQAQQIFIPNEMVGCIIGKGGSKINEIRQLSGSHIKIADPHGNTNERLVTITGTPESNQMALYLLYSRLESEKGRLGLR